MTVQEWLGADNQLGIDIWTKKYCYNGESFDCWLDRVSGGDSAVKQAILDQKFLFGGRILANRSIDVAGKTYSNCYVIPPVEDNIESIYDTCSKLARTFSYGGGCGVDISKLRPCGAKVNNAARTTTGAVSFMQTFSTVSETIGQHGRRGALMLSIDVNHPDVTEFIGIKNDLSKVTGANISVRVNDQFMDAVVQDKDYLLRWPCQWDETDASQIVQSSVEGICRYAKDKYAYDTLYPITNDGKEIGYFKRVKARELFNKLCENNWDYAEPGILYWDRISRWNMVSEDEDFQYAGVNPCANLWLVLVV